MDSTITPVSLSLPLRMGRVNCFLVKTDTGFVLIDTGSPNSQTELEKALENAGCRPGDLKLIVVTHGDFDHTGNAAYLRKRFDGKIAMHHDDVAMAEHGDMFANRGSANLFTRMMSPLIPILFGFGRSKRFTPDLVLEDGSDLSEYGLDAKVLSLPGHSKGSIGILTKAGDLFCGDLFENTAGPAINSIMDDSAAANQSATRLERLHIRTVYPGHGKPFPIVQLKDNRQGAEK
jgi:hydroxyacylglutathione hydrolase